MTVEPTLSQKFTDALRDKFQRETNLTLLTKGGDLQIEGSITGYRTSPVAIQANETAAMNRLTISVEVTFTNTVDDSKSYKSSFSRYEDYPSSQNLSEVQETLIDQINEMLTSHGRHLGDHRGGHAARKERRVVKVLQHQAVHAARRQRFRIGHGSRPHRSQVASIARGTGQGQQMHHADHGARQLTPLIQQPLAP